MWRFESAGGVEYTRHFTCLTLVSLRNAETTDRTQSLFSLIWSQFSISFSQELWLTIHTCTQWCIMDWMHKIGQILVDSILTDLGIADLINIQLTSYFIHKKTLLWHVVYAKVFSYLSTAIASISSHHSPSSLAQRPATCPRFKPVFPPSEKWKWPPHAPRVNSSTGQLGEFHQRFKHSEFRHPKW